MNNEFLAFFLANEYVRAMGRPGLADMGKAGKLYEHLANIADRYVDVASGKLDVEGLATGNSGEEDYMKVS